MINCALAEQWQRSDPLQALQGKPLQSNFRQSAVFETSISPLHFIVFSIIFHLPNQLDVYIILQVTNSTFLNALIVFESPQGMSRCPPMRTSCLHSFAKVCMHHKYLFNKDRYGIGDVAGCQIGNNGRLIEWYTPNYHTTFQSRSPVFQLWNACS